MSSKPLNKKVREIDNSKETQTPRRRIYQKQTNSFSHFFILSFLFLVSSLFPPVECDPIGCWVFLRLLYIFFDYSGSFFILYSLSIMVSFFEDFFGVRILFQTNWMFGLYLFIWLFWNLLMENWLFFKDDGINKLFNFPSIGHSKANATGRFSRGHFSWRTDRKRIAPINATQFLKQLHETYLLESTI